jgi:hypothetical protein
MPLHPLFFSVKNVKSPEKVGRSPDLKHKSGQKNDEFLSKKQRAEPCVQLLKSSKFPYFFFV